METDEPLIWRAYRTIARRLNWFHRRLMDRTDLAETAEVRSSPKRDRGQPVQYQILYHTAASRFLNSLQISSARSAWVGGAGALASLPGNHDPFRVPVEIRQRTGVLDSTIRLSIGIEHASGPDRRHRPGLEQGAAIAPPEASLQV